MKWNKIPEKTPEFGIEYALAVGDLWHKGVLKNIGYEEKTGRKLFQFTDLNGDPVYDVTHFMKLDLPAKPKE